MRIGVLTNWLSKRYLPFWEAYLQELGLQVIRPQADQVNLPFPEPIRQVIGAVMSLKNQGVDYLLLPDVQLGRESKKGNPSSWMVDLPASLQGLLPGMPPAMVVPAELSPEVAGIAAKIGQSLTRNLMVTRRALERSKYLLAMEFKPPKQAGSNLIGIVAQPVVLDDSETVKQLGDALQSCGLELFLADKSPQELREEGEKLELGLELPTDLEAAGMHRYLCRLGKIKGLLYLHSEYFPLAGPLRKLAKHSNKPWRMGGLDANWEKIVGELAKELDL